VASIMGPDVSSAIRLFRNHSHALRAVPQRWTKIAIIPNSGTTGSGYIILHTMVTAMTTTPASIRQATKRLPSTSIFSEPYSYSSVCPFRIRLRISHETIEVIIHFAYSKKSASSSMEFASTATVSTGTKKTRSSSRLSRTAFSCSMALEFSQCLRFFIITERLTQVMILSMLFAGATI